MMANFVLALVAIGIIFFLWERFAGFKWVIISVIAIPAILIAYLVVAESYEKNEKEKNENLKKIAEAEFYKRHPEIKAGCDCTEEEKFRHPQECSSALDAFLSNAQGSWIETYCPSIDELLDLEKKNELQKFDRRNILKKELEDEKQFLENWKEIKLSQSSNSTSNDDNNTDIVKDIHLRKIESIQRELKSLKNSQ